MPLDETQFVKIFDMNKRKAAAKFNRRETKIDLAMTQMNQAVDQLEKRRANVKRFRIAYQSFNEQILKAENVGQHDPAEGHKLLETIKKKAREQRDAALQELRDSDLYDVAKTQVPGIDHPVQLHPQSMPGLENLTTVQQQAVVATVSAKIGRGKTLMDTVLTSDPTTLPNPTMTDVADFAWFIKTMSEEKCGEAFAKGSMTIPDPGNKLRRYLDRCGEIYGRDSSHLKEQQDAPLGKARGIDFYDGDLGPNIEELLPYGMNTLLTQAITTSGGDDLLYIKMETESARFNPLFPVKQAKRKLFGEQEETPDARPLEKADVGRSIKHLVNLLKAHDNGSLAAFREQTPQNIVDAYAQCITTAKHHKDKEVAKVLKTGFQTARNWYGKTKDPGVNSVRVHDITQNVMDVDHLLTSGQVTVHPDTLNALIACFSAVLDEFGDSLGDLSTRMGGEIVLGSGDLDGTLKSNEKQVRMNVETELALEELDGVFDVDIDQIEDWLVDWQYLLGAYPTPGDVNDSLEEYGQDAGLTLPEIADIQAAVTAKAANDPHFTVNDFKKALTAVMKLRPVNLARSIVPFIKN